MTGESPGEKFRLFVAIPVPDTVRDEMIRIQRELSPLAPRGAVRWTKPEQFHLTLRFLGDVSSGSVADLRESVHAVCAGAPVLHLRAQGVGFFPHARSPRVIWIGVNDDDNRLADLQEKIEGAVHPFTTESGGGRFAGHVTLGRFKQFNRGEIGALTARAKGIKNGAFGGWTAFAVELVRSELSRIGTIHAVLATFPLLQD